MPSVGCNTKFWVVPVEEVPVGYESASPQLKKTAMRERPRGLSGGCLDIGYTWSLVIGTCYQDSGYVRWFYVVNWVEQVGNEMSVSRLELVQSMFDASMEIVDHHVG